MSLTKANGRSSAINISCPWRSNLPFPNGAISAEDRAHTAFMYLLASSGSPGDDVISMSLAIARRRRR